MNSREYLKIFVNKYIVALENKDFSELPVSDTYKYSENCELIKLGEGIISYPVKETLRLEIYDVKTSQAAVQSVLDNGEKLIMFFLRLKIHDDKITEIETLVNPGDKGVPVPFDPANLTEISEHWKRSIRPAERDSRFKLMDVADGYWRAMETEGTADYVRPAILPDTERYENGMHTTNEPMPDFSEIFGDDGPVFIPAYPFPDDGPHTALADFDHGTWRSTSVEDRRYPVIDEERGIIVSLARFGSQQEDRSKDPDAGPAPYVAEFFAVTRGWIREVHVVIAAIKPSVPTPWPLDIY
ncbi:hypothetical protein ACFL6W_04570 [Thermodesulfobacteriota bacterium]